MTNLQNSSKNRYINFKKIQKENIILKQAAITQKNTPLTTEFYIELENVANRLNMNPADILAIMFSESGLDASIQNTDYGSVGLLQWMPNILPAYYKGKRQDFANMPSVEQLKYVEATIRGQMRMNNGKPFRCAAKFYQANFLPATLTRGDSADTIICRKEGGASFEALAYQHNKGFDIDNDGVITLGDMQKHLEKRIIHSSKFQGYLEELNKATNGNYSVSLLNDSGDGSNEDNSSDKSNDSSNDSSNDNSNDNSEEQGNSSKSNSSYSGDPFEYLAGKKTNKSQKSNNSSKSNSTHTDDPFEYLAGKKTNSPQKQNKSKTNTYNNISKDISNITTPASTIKGINLKNPKEDDDEDEESSSRGLSNKYKNKFLPSGAQNNNTQNITESSTPSDLEEEMRSTIQQLKAASPLNYTNLQKFAIIKKENNKYIIYSKKHKRLGKYKTKKEALKRLKQIEYFKHKTANTSNNKEKFVKVDHMTYSAIIRALRKMDEKLMNEFQKCFYNCFNKFVLQHPDKCEDLALANTLNKFRKKHNILFEQHG